MHPYNIPKYSSEYTGNSMAWVPKQASGQKNAGIKAEVRVWAKLQETHNLCKWLLTTTVFMMSISACDNLNLYDIGHDLFITYLPN